LPIASSCSLTCSENQKKQQLTNMVHAMIACLLADLEPAAAAAAARAFSSLSFSSLLCKEFARAKVRGKRIINLTVIIKIIIITAIIINNNELQSTNRHHHRHRDCHLQLGGGA
jgi:hypothetical protein